MKQISIETYKKALDKGIKYYLCTLDKWLNLTARMYQCELQKILRDKGIHVNPYPTFHYVDKEWDGYFCGAIFNDKGIILYVGDDTFSTHEEALEFGLNKALDFI